MVKKLLVEAFNAAKAGLFAIMFSVLRRALSESNRAKTLHTSGMILVTLRKMHEKRKAGLIVA